MLYIAECYFLVNMGYLALEELFHENALSDCRREAPFCGVGQGIGGKFPKLGKISFSVGCFRGDISQFSSAFVEIFISGGQLRTCL